MKLDCYWPLTTTNVAWINSGLDPSPEWSPTFCLLNKNYYRRFRHANDNTDLEKGKEKKGAGSNNPYYSRSHKIEASGAILLGPLSRQSLLLLYAMRTITLRKNKPSSLFSGITSFAGSNQMIFISMLTCAIGSQGGPNKMAAANFLWLHFHNNRGSIQSFFFFGDQ